ncbi:outer membrane protein assembly factor BamB family protein [Halobacterium jilantaiense]|uniref:Outer membrane protein assembly factor BamB, contains PQQ-like beta-propeller repeat n=1 Tax=Halobacterium jilantaiense TaxID=355548 RepID=A0A1I0Q242_9EURY|nr:PQQ-binding-like beta-propeller repeat protein [Halobacterium jilantaiense]SEW20851.1 Outer membrane protein assembly factor BamB, contains PQQ-like beta-propeller repeat [Halobacterium jilantaiense]
MPSTSRRDALRLLAAGGVAGLAGCSSFNLGKSSPNEKPPASLGTSWSPSEDAWPFPSGDPQNTAQSPDGVPSQPTVEWTDGTGGDSVAAEERGDLVAATPSRVVAARQFDDGVHLRALAADGTRQWDRRLEFPSEHPNPRYGGLVDGSLYLVGAGNDVVALNAADGTVRWRRNLYEQVAEDVPAKFLLRNGSSEDFAAMLLATPETLYVQTPYGIHGLAPSDGTEQWRLRFTAELSDTVLARPVGLAVTDSGVWASYAWPAPLLFAVELGEDGPRIQRTRLPFRDYPGTPVAVSDRTVVLASGVTWSTRPGETLAVGATTNDTEWQFPGHTGEGGAAYSRLATDGERAFVCQATEQPERMVVSALRTETGKLEWSHRESLADRDVRVADGQTFRLCQTVVAGDSVVVGFGQRTDGAMDRGAILALSRDAGRVRWRADIPVAPEGVMVTRDRLYVGGQRGGVVALGTRRS